MTYSEERSSMFDPPPEPPAKKGMSRGLLFGIIGCVTLLVLIGVGVAVGGLAGLSLLGEVAQQRQSNIPALLSEDTQIYGSITPALSDIPNIARIQNAYPELFEDGRPSGLDEQLAELGLNFEEDIQPWIGPEASFAVSGVTDFQMLAQAMEESDDSADELFKVADVALIISARDDNAAQAFLQKLRTGIEGQGDTVLETTHNNVTIYHEEAPTDRAPAAFALVKGNVVFASKLELLQQMIDRDPAGSDTLAANQRFQNLRANQPADAIGYIYIDGRFVGEGVTQTTEEAILDMPADSAERLSQQLENIQAVQAVGLSISVEETGVGFDATVTADVEQVDEESQEMLEAAREPVDASRLESISGDSLALMTFKIPPGFKDQVLEGFRSQPDGEESLEEMEAQTGLNLEKDVLDWLVGDVSLVILPGDQMGDVTFPAAGYLAITSENPESAEAGMAKIADVIEQSINMPFTSETIGGADWQVLAEPSSGQIFGGYGFIGDDVVIAFGNSAMESVTDESDTPITENAMFTAVTNNLPDPNGGVFYFDVQEMVALGDSLGTSMSPEEEEARQNMEAIGAIGAAGQPGLNDQGVGQARLFVYIRDTQQ